MLKIKNSLYKDALIKHATHISPFVRRRLSFYVHCFDVIDGKAYEEDYYKELNIHGNSINSIIKTLLIPSNNNIVNKKNTKILLSNNTKVLQKINTNLSSLKHLFKNLLNDKSKIYFDRIISADPIELLEIHKSLVQNYSFLFDELYINYDFKKMFEHIFAYDYFIEGRIANWDAYDLSSKLGVKVCPYCNRQFTYTIINDKEYITRPEIDHYLPKAKYPYLALSFFNLIPCCSICNSALKKDIDFGNNPLFHPYLSSDTEELHFEFVYKCNAETVEEIESTLEICILPNCKDDVLFTFINKIEKIYQEHKDIAALNIWKNKVYTDKYIDDLSKLVSTNNSSVQNNKDNLILAIFPKTEKYLNILNSPLAKLIKDSKKKL